MNTGSLVLAGALVSLWAVPTIGWGANQTDQQGTGEPSQQSDCPPLDVNAEMGRGHLGPHDPATKRGSCDEDEQRPSHLGRGQRDPLSGGKRLGSSGKSAEADHGRRDANKPPGASH